MPSGGRHQNHLETTCHYPTVKPVIGNSETIQLLHTKVGKEYSVRFIFLLSELNGKSQD